MSEVLLSWIPVDSNLIGLERINQDINKVLHLFCSVFYLYLIYFDWTKLNWPERPISDKLNKFTNWNYTLLTCYWLASTANDMLQISWLTDYLQDLAFGIILPCSVVVCVGFWTLYSVDPNLIRCSHFQQKVGYCPLWYSHATHTLVLVLPLLEVWLGTMSKMANSDILSSLKSTAAQSDLIGSAMNYRTLSLYTVWASSYAFVVFYFGLKNSAWPYPFMNRISLAAKILLGLLSSAAGLVCMMLVTKLYQMFMLKMIPDPPIRHLTFWERLTESLTELLAR